MKRRAPRPRPRLLIRCALAVLAAASLVPAHAAPGELEAKIKAAYVFHIMKFVDWPSLPTDALHLCVAGNDSVTLLLADLAGKQVKDRSLKIDSDGKIGRASCRERV